MDNWKYILTQALQNADMYKTYHDVVIDMTADILTQRDKAYERFLADGRYTVDNDTINPLLDVWMQLNSLALTCMRDLGLTPMGLTWIRDMEALEEAERGRTC